ncbi:TetR/AcrR family transcriptional regulator [Microbacterium insulae]|uniref:TetR/AcrR family transcriptional regulator n=1 Tax=Microbacterium insulae TaxID=483014 RepID=A0ABW3AF90_9MICO
MSNLAARTRRPAGETRALLLETAIERVSREGLRIDFANLELEDLIRAAGVPRSTVFRIWPDRDAFIGDLVRALFDADPGFEAGFDEETLELLEHAIAEASKDADPAEARRAVLRAVVRRTTAHNIVAVEDSVTWRAYRTLSAALVSGDSVPGGESIRTLLGEIDRRYVSRMATVYRRLNESLGLRMRAPLTEQDLALSIMAVIEGMSDHRRIDPLGVDRPRMVATGDEEPEPWHLVGLAVHAVYEAFTEPAG